MGIGDLLMAAGRAKLLHRKTGKIISIGDGRTALWSNLFQYNPYLSSRPAEEWIVISTGNHPYLGPYTKEHRNFVHAHRPEPAEIFWGPDEGPRKGFYGIIEPNIKPGAPLPKKWPTERYQAVVDEIDIPWVQLYIGGEKLRNVDIVPTTLREAAEYMAGASVFVVPEGGLHHLAAAVGTPGVVLFNSWHPPYITGYDIHTNLYIHDLEVMGYTRRANRALIEVEEVCESVRNIVKNKKPSTRRESTAQQA